MWWGHCAMQFRKLDVSFSLMEELFSWEHKVQYQQDAGDWSQSCAGFSGRFLLSYTACSKCKYEASTGFNPNTGLNVWTGPTRQLIKAGVICWSTEIWKVKGLQKENYAVACRHLKMDNRLCCSFLSNFCFQPWNKSKGLAAGRVVVLW